MTDYENFTFYDWYRIYYNDEVKNRSVARDDLKDLFDEYEAWCETHLFKPTRLTSVLNLYGKEL